MRSRWYLLWAALVLPAVVIGRAAAPVPAGGARSGLVVSAHHLASAAGAEVLRQGGNAVDAAVATGLALAVVHPQAGNLGGGGFMLIHLADASPAGRNLVIDYRETAPRASSRDMYVGPDGRLLTGAGSSTEGWRASGVPGTVPGLAWAFVRYGSGRVTWAQVCEPARRLAVEGHTISAATAENLREEAALLGADPESRRIFLKDGAQHAAGDLWVQPELGATLTRLQANGAAEFATGETARRIAAAMAAHGGTLTLEDLRDYRPVERRPLPGRYRGFDIVTMPPPSSGGIALLQMLAMLEPHDVRALAPGSADRCHLLAEAMKRAFRDRAEYLGDPDFVRVPVAALLAPDYVRGRMADYRPDRATPAAEVKSGLGAFDPRNLRPERFETTHFSVVDAAGNAVANTYTLNGAYGSGVTIPGTGVLMNNEMDDFTAQVGSPNLYGLIQGEANAIVPGKRPLSSMTPTMVFRDGRLVLVTGSPGGPTIINTVLQVIVNVIDDSLPITAAVAAPRLHHQWMPDRLTFEPGGLSLMVLEDLRRRGHVLQERTGSQGRAHSLAIDAATGRREGAADPRNPNAAAVRDKPE